MTIALKSMRYCVAEAASICGAVHATSPRIQ